MIAITYRNNPDSATMRGGRISRKYGHRDVPKTGLDLLCRQFPDRISAAAYIAAAPELAASGKFGLVEV
jgi:hypothetical protein